MSKVDKAATLVIVGVVLMQLAWFTATGYGLYLLFGALSKYIHS